MYQLRKKILPILVPSMVEAENFSDHPLRCPYSRNFPDITECRIPFTSAVA